MEKIRATFGVIEDPRHQGYLKHTLADVLIMIMGAIICGISDLAGMMVYFENKIDFYTKYFGIEKYPSKPTLSRILSLVDANAVGAAIVGLMRENAGNLGEIIAVDGKAIRSTGKKDKAHSFLQILTAYATESGITLGQESISYEAKTNEIPVFQSMLDYLEIKGKTITAGAMHCQKVTCAKIIEKEADYAFGLKGNQGSLLGDVELYFMDPINAPDFSTFQTLEKNGGRIEKRVCHASENVSWLPDLNKWAGLKTIYAITRTVTAQGKTTQDTDYYITSRAKDPQELLYVTRSHWMVENMHWSLDVIWKEDESGLLSENALKSINCFSKMALLGHKKIGCVSEKETQCEKQGDS